MTRSDDSSTSGGAAANQESAVIALPVVSHEGILIVIFFSTFTFIFQDPSAHEVVLKSLKDLKEKQKSLFTEHCRKLDAISKKQNQAQKQSDTYGKRSDQNGIFYF